METVNLNIMMESLGLVSGGTFAVLAAFLFVAFPIWCVVDCARDPERPERERTGWIAAILTVPGFGPLAYGLFATDSRPLKAGMGVALTSALGMVFLLSGVFGQGLRETELRKSIVQAELRAQAEVAPALGRITKPKSAAANGKFLAVWKAHGKRLKPVAVFAKNGRAIFDRVGAAPNVTHVAEDNSGHLYGVIGRGFGSVSATGKLVKIEAPKAFSRQLYTGLAFDRIDDRFFLLSASGSGHLMEYSTRTELWKALGGLKNRKYQGLALDHRTSVLYTALETRGRALTSLVKLSATGELSGEIKLSKPIAVPKGATVQLSFAADTIAVVVGERDDRLFFIDKTGKVSPPVVEVAAAAKKAQAKPLRAPASPAGKHGKRRVHRKRR